jgi:isoleucyl-tRNA synthetase
VRGLLLEAAEIVGDVRHAGTGAWPCVIYHENPMWFLKTSKAIRLPVLEIRLVVGWMGGRGWRGRLQRWLGLRVSRGLCFSVHRC